MVLSPSTGYQNRSLATNPLGSSRNKSSCPQPQAVCVRRRYTEGEQLAPILLCACLGSCRLEETAMRALTIAPGKQDSARLDDIPEPSAEEGSILVEGLVMGVCGTDREL